MKNIFLAPRSNETAYKNYISSMQGVPKSRLEQYLSDDDKKKLANIDLVHAWGCQPNLEGYWDSMQYGDYIFFYAKGSFISVGELVFKKKSEGLALALWPRNKDTNLPWSCVFFVDKLVDIDLSLEDFNKLTGYKLGLVRGFMPVKTGINRIIGQFGSTEEFIKYVSSGLSGEVLNELKASSTKTLAKNSYEEIARIDELTREIDEEKLAQALEDHASRAYGKKPEQIKKIVTTFKRNQKLVKDIKARYGNKCQICGFTFRMANGNLYSEAAHIIPISSQKEGVDSPDNIWVLCANHHRMLDTGAISSTSLTQYKIGNEIKNLKT